MSCSKAPWKVVEHSYPIADTGDYDYSCELTDADGKTLAYSEGRTNVVEDFALMAGAPAMKKEVERLQNVVRECRKQLWNATAIADWYWEEDLPLSRRTPREEKRKEKQRFDAETEKLVNGK